MHRSFLDKRRRYLNLRSNKVESILPEHFQEYYPKFITLLKKYYEWQDENDSTELLNHLFATRDINEADITLLSYIEDELLLGGAYFQGFGETEAEKRAAANFSNILFRSKGSKFAIEWFFRSFYGLDAEVFYTKENIFVVGDAQSQIGPDSLRFLTNDKLFQTFALLVRVGIPISKWRDIFKLFAHPAGMYLGSEVSINDTINAALNLPMSDSDSIQTRITPAYSIAYDTPGDSVDEGETITWTVTATGLPENIGAVYWYIDHVTTSDSDFVVAPPFDSDADYLALDSSAANQAAGIFTTDLAVDSDESEGTEQFSLSIKDEIGKVLATTFVDIKDVVASYNITASGPVSGSGTTFNEGELITFVVTGSNIPSNGNTILYWHVVHGTTVNSDFTVTPPSVSSPQALTIANDSGRFTLRSIVDGASDNGETFNVVLKTPPGGASGILKDTLTITLNNTAPVLSVSSNSIFEGQDLIFSVTTDSSNIGRTLDWAISGSAATDSRVTDVSGTLLMTTINEEIVVPVLATDSYHGVTSGTITVTNNTVAGAPFATDTFTITDLAPVYTLTPNPATAVEGDTISFEVDGTNIPSGTVYFFIQHGTTTNADFTVTPPQNTSRQAVTLTANATPNGTSSSLTFANNGDTTNENFTAFIYDASTGGNQLATTNFTIAADTYTLTSGSASINEGSSNTFTLVTTAPDGTYYYWFGGTNITSADLSSTFYTNASRGTFTVSGGNGSFNITAANDFTNEGNEVLNAFISNTSTDGALASASVTLVDTSKPAYVVSAPDITEGNTLTVTITSTSNSTETVYIEVSGAGVTGRFSSTQTTKVITGSTTTTATFTTTSSSTYQGPQSGTVTVSRGNYNSLGGTSLATDTFLMNDATSAYTLSVDDTTPNEGYDMLFTVTGSNIPSTIYFYRVNGVYGKSVTTTVAGGSSIPLSNTTSLAVGMTCSNASVPGTITSISTNSITMSNVVSGSIVSGTILNFAQPSLFADFTPVTEAHGAFAIAANTGTFNMQLATNDDIGNESYTVSLYDNEAGTGTALATRSFTIQDLTPAASVALPADFSTENNGFITGFARAGIRLHSDGTITTSGAVPLETSLDTVYIGNWLTDISGLDPSLYTASATYTVTVNSSGINTGYSVTPATTPTGSLVLSTDRDFSITVTSGTTGLAGGALSDVTVVFTITVTGPTNSDTVVVTARAQASYFYASPPGPIAPSFPFGP